MRSDLPAYFQSVQVMGMVVPQLAYLTTVVIVDADVDVRDYSEVLWAYSNNVRPEVDLMITDKELADLERPDRWEFIRIWLS